MIEAQEPLYPGFLRVIWDAHVAEWSDLNASDRALLMSVVTGLEQFVREQFQPDKVNLASLGNVVPHLHWHIIPRFKDDAHFPAPVWAQAAEGKGLAPRQQTIKTTESEWLVKLEAYIQALTAELAAGGLC